MAYTKKEWADGEVITKDALNNIENGVKANETAIGGKADASTAATKTELGQKAKKGDAISAADATAAAGANPTKEEFAKVVTLVNACKAELNKMNA